LAGFHWEDFHDRAVEFEVDGGVGGEGLGFVEEVELIGPTVSDEGVRGLRVIEFDEGGAFGQLRLFVFDDFDENDLSVFDEVLEEVLFCCRDGEVSNEDLVEVVLLLLEELLLGVVALLLHRLFILAFIR
jgi:hypothetical protein